jgi:glycogen debranching enzyme
VQAYVYRALSGCSELAERMGEPARALDLAQRARTLAERIHQAFWLDEEGYYALALDRDKRRCRVLTTNPGHLLWAGAVPSEAGRRTARRLTTEELSSGFGLRTLSRNAPRFNPVSYHNGSIWPHDNAIVAEGLRRYGHLAGAFEVLDGLMAAMSSSGEVRIPELYCGFQRRGDERMTPYPVACAPQAWSSGALLAFLRTMLGLTVDAHSRMVRFEDPVLPAWLDWVEVRNLPVPGGRMDFLTIRGRTSCAVEILSKSPEVRVQVTM